jgi:hypothetical protein
VLPFVLLLGALLVDLAVTFRVPGWLAGPLVAGAVYGAAVGQEALGLLPPWNWWSVLPVAVGFALLWAGVDLLARSRWLARGSVADEPAGAGVGAR